MRGLLQGLDLRQWSTSVCCLCLRCWAGSQQFWPLKRKMAEKHKRPKTALPVALTMSSPDDADHLQVKPGPFLGEVHMHPAQLLPHASEVTTCVTWNSADLQSLKRKTPVSLWPSQSHASVSCGLPDPEAKGQGHSRK